MATIPDLQVSASTDDVRKASDNTGVYFATHNSQYHGHFDNGSFNQTFDNGYRWQNVAISQGSTVTTANLDLYSSIDSPNGDPLIRIYGYAEDNLATFANGTFIGLPRTTAFVDVTLTAATWHPNIGFGNQLIDISSLLTEIVQRPGWVSGNALGIVITDNGSTQGDYVGGNTYDRDPARGAMITSINFTPAGGASRRRTILVT